MAGVKEVKVSTDDIKGMIKALGFNPGHYNIRLCVGPNETSVVMDVNLAAVEKLTHADIVRGRNLRGVKVLVASKVDKMFEMLAKETFSVYGKRVPSSVLLDELKRREVERDGK